MMLLRKSRTNNSAIGTLLICGMDSRAFVAVILRYFYNMRCKKFNSSIEDMISKYCFAIGILLLAAMYIFLIFNSFPMHTPSEELGALSGAAFLADFDWSNVVSKDCNYYGVGFYSICAPLFAFLDDPIVIYRCIIGINALIRLVISVVSYYIGKVYFEIENRLILSLATLCVPLFQVSRITRGAHNDLILEGVFWVVLLFVCRLLCSTTPFKIILSSFWVTVFLLYGLTIHTRWLIVIFSYLFVLFVVCILDRTKWKVFIPSLVLLGCGYFIVDCGIERWKSVLWLSEGPLLNGNISVSHNIDYFSPGTWNLWKDILLGNIATEVIVSGGIASFVIVLLLIFFYFKIKNKEKSECSMHISVVTGISFICVIATLLGLLVSEWTSEMLSGNQYSFKAMTYLRYWGAYASPLFLCAVAASEKFELLKKCKNVSLSISIITIILFIHRILPYIKDNSDALLNSFIGISGYSYGSQIAIRDHFGASIAISFFIIICSYILISHNRVPAALFMILLFLALCSFSASWKFDIPQQKSFFQSVNNIVDYYMGIENDKKPEKIVVFENDPKRNNNFKQSVMLQFYLFRIPVCSGDLDELERGDVVVSRESISNTLLDCYDYEEKKLDEDEFWYWIQ